ncbi:MarR family transcriptional regulator, partial [Micrococcus endophyticus]
MTSADHRPEPDTAPEPEAFPALEDPYRRSLLTNEQRNAWAALSAACLGLVSQMESDLHRDAGLTPFEFHLLYVLGAEEASREAEGTMPMSRAAQLVDSSLSRLSHVVRRIEERGWVERRPSAEDARVTLVSLTPEGRRRMEPPSPPTTGWSAASSWTTWRRRTSPRSRGCRCGCWPGCARTTGCSTPWTRTG